MTVTVLLLACLAASLPDSGESFDDVFASLGESLEQSAARHLATHNLDFAKPTEHSLVVETGQRPADFNLSLIESRLIGIGTGKDWVTPSLLEYAKSCLPHEEPATIPMTGDHWQVRAKKATFVFRFKKRAIIAKIVFPPAENLTCFPRGFSVRAFGKRLVWEEVAHGAYQAGNLGYQEVLVAGKEEAMGGRIDVIENWGDPEYVCLSNIRFLAPL
jgi:hypothetical protein